MNDQFSCAPGGRCLAFWAGCSLMILCLGPPLAEADDLASRVAAHLGSGEFAPALELANSAEEASERDALMRLIAERQAGSGQRNAAFSTARLIGGDLARTDALKALAADSMAHLPASWTSRGGDTEAEFDAVIELITSTIAPASWDEVGGAGAIAEFAGGVYVDSTGLMEQLTTGHQHYELESLRRRAASAGDRIDLDEPSPIRMVSLTRLEREVQLLWAQGKPPTDAMQMLAGLSRIEYVFIYPEEGDIVIAGPAGPWTFDSEGRPIDQQTGRPMLRLDDLVVVLRNALGGTEGVEPGCFGCSITPRQENLARTRAFLQTSSERPLAPGVEARNRWMEELRATLGRQEIEVYGIDPRSHAARVIVEADYHMKLVGMGLQEGALGVVSFLEAASEQGGTDSLDVLRWWFALNYEAVVTSADRQAFAFRGQALRVLSENELLNEQGERIHTGESELLNREFARSFSRHYPQMAARYPIYAELENLADMAMVAGLICQRDLADQVDWHLPHFGPEGAYCIERGRAPAEIESVIASRDIDRGRFIAQVSGGVSIDPSDLLGDDGLETSNDAEIESAQKWGEVPLQLPVDRWWWD